jgi:hypothetical protein
MPLLVGGMELLLDEKAKASPDKIIAANPTKNE